MNKRDVIDWISGHYGQSGDPLLETIELLEIEEACADRRAQMYAGAHEAALSYKSSMVNYGGRLIKVMPEDAEKTAFYFDLLLGDNLAGRKEYIAENGSQYLEMADIS